MAAKSGLKAPLLNKDNLSEIAINMSGLEAEPQTTSGGSSSAARNDPAQQVGAATNAPRPNDNFKGSGSGGVKNRDTADAAGGIVNGVKSGGKSGGSFSGGGGISAGARTLSSSHSQGRRAKKRGSEAGSADRAAAVADGGSPAGGSSKVGSPKGSAKGVITGGKGRPPKKGVGGRGSRKGGWWIVGKVGLHWVLGVIGTILIAVALGLHYSGVEPVDLLYQDDKCYKSNKIMYQGMPVDACLNRSTVEIGIDCGEPAADKFCKLLGANYFVNYTYADVQAPRGAVSLGNHFIGGKLGFGEVCCDEGAYKPAPSRWLLFIGGIAWTYLLTAGVTKLLLVVLEVVVVRVFDAGELLYFFLDVEKPLRLLLWVGWLLHWTSFTLWDVWCYEGIDCEAHGSLLRSYILKTVQCFFGFAVVHFISSCTPRIITARFFFRREFAKIKDMMQKEALLAALTKPAADKEQRAAIPGFSAGLDNNIHDQIAELQLGKLGAIASFHTFLKKYQSADVDALKEEASREGKALFEALSSYDLNRDGTVGIQDLEQLFEGLDLEGWSGSKADAAKAAWAMFDLNADNVLTEEEVIAALELVYMDRVNMALTVLSNDSAVSSLATAISMVAYTLMLFVCLHILDLQTSFGENSLDFFTTYVLALSFIFGDTVRSVFRSAIYIFGEHPFNVGDFLMLEDELWQVDSFDLIYTSLYKYEQNSWVKIPNDSLIDSQVVNVSRGRAFQDGIGLEMPLATPWSVVEVLKKTLAATAEENPKEFVIDATDVYCDNIVSGQMLNIQCDWTYNFSPAERDRIATDRVLMIERIRAVLIDEDVPNIPSSVEYRLVKTKAE